MAAISSPGVGSGLDINSLVSKLMDVERAPLTRLDTKEAAFQAKLSAYGSLKGSLSAFQTAARNLSTPAKFNSMRATAGDAAVLTATTNSVAKPGNYSIEVSQLAQAHKIASPPSAEAGFADLATVIGSGSLRIEFGTYDGGDFTLNADKQATTIIIDSTNNTVSGIRDAINAANAGVSASIVNDGEGYRLVLSSSEAGAKNALKISVDEGGAPEENTDTSGLSRLAYDADTKNMQQTVAAQSAMFEIDGIAITRNTNTIGDAITGVMLNLLKTNEDNPTQLSVARETSGVKTAVEQFVSAYNELANTIKTLGGYDFKTQKGGILLGDSALRSVQAQLRNVMNQQLRHAGGGLSSLSEIGIAFQPDGSLALNGGKLDAVLADSTKDVASLFAVMGRPSDSLITYSGSSSATQPGIYDVLVTQTATRGTATGSVALGETTTIAGNANALTLKIDGISATVSLTAGDYSASELIAEVQTRINSDSRFSSRGIKVSVSQDDNGQLVLTSARYGASSKVEITDTSAATGLFGSATSVTGKDVAGEIGGKTATGTGQILAGAGNASGLQLLVSGGGTGARGTVGFSLGIADQLDKTIQKMLGSEGAIAYRSGGIDTSVKDISDQRIRLSRRLALIEERYKKQFNALDGLIASMQQTSTYLQQQLANLPNTSSRK